MQFLGPAPTGTVSTQRPLAQPLPTSQAASQSPQCALSFSRSTQALLQAVRPGTHSAEHTPAEQTSSPTHSLPQAPQFFGSALVGMQTPLHSER